MAVRIGLIGCGTVGSAFVEALRERAPAIEAHTGARLELAEVAVAHPAAPRAVFDTVRTDGYTRVLGDTRLGETRLHGDAAAIAADPSIDIVVEASGAPAASSWLLVALTRGATVVTANKRALTDEPALLDALARHEPRLRCEAAVAGAVPVVSALRDALAADEIRAIRGVLNGTTTYVLSQLDSTDQGPGKAFGHEKFDQAIRDAQAAGYAEADPSQDLRGADAAAKLAILSTLAWRRPIAPSQVTTCGIDHSILVDVAVARSRGARVRLIASATPAPTGVRASVLPLIVDRDDPLFHTTGVDNIVELDTALAGRLSFRGPGAGGRPTASALLADTVAAARDLISAGALATS
jgi:homoserine dehydrogenase